MNPEKPASTNLPDRLDLTGKATLRRPTPGFKRRSGVDIRRVILLRERGQSYACIARQTGVSAERVRQVVAERRPDLLGRTSRRYIDDEEEERILDLRHEGLTTVQIAAQMKRSASAVRRVIERAGISSVPRRGRGLTVANLRRNERIVRLRRKGWSVQDLARELDVSARVVCYTLAKHAPDLSPRFRDQGWHSQGGLMARNEEIIELRRQGLSFAEIAAQMKISVQIVRYAVRKMAQG